MVQPGTSVSVSLPVSRVYKVRIFFLTSPSILAGDELLSFISNDFLTGLTCIPAHIRLNRYKKQGDYTVSEL